MRSIVLSNFNFLKSFDKFSAKNFSKKILKEPRISLLFMVSFMILTRFALTDAESFNATFRWRVLKTKEKITEVIISLNNVIVGASLLKSNFHLIFGQTRLLTPRTVAQHRYQNSKINIVPMLHCRYTYMERVWVCR